MSSSEDKIRKRIKLSESIATQLEHMAKATGQTESRIIETALQAHLNPEPPDFIRLEEGLGTTLRQQGRAISTLQKDVGLCTETIAQFVRLYLGTTMPPNEKLREEILRGAPERWRKFTRDVRGQVIKNGPYVREILKDEG